jgi:hypothetical protein
MGQQDGEIQGFGILFGKIKDNDSAQIPVFQLASAG